MRSESDRDVAASRNPSTSTRRVRPVHRARACACVTPGTETATASAVVTMSGSTPSSRRCAMSAVTSQPTWQMNPVTTIPATASAQPQPSATPIRPSTAPADESASSHECLASATMVADRIRLPTTSL
ncbi:hypothetical protein AFC81_03370 [Mycobacterium avium subsp. paratuberculosis]|nr:hypothetical protein AFC81_03370 [Mycobacterium avium subsp. paratuberculosis]